MLAQDLALIELVQDREAYLALLADLKQQARIAVDTESNSLHAYRERVCLIQFSTSERDYVLDALAFEDIREVGGVFSDDSVEKIFHAAEYDIICLRRDYGFAFANIFDTMQAGRILGRKMAGLDRLLEEKFSLKVSKRLQKADWGARPLRPELVAYAAQDTHYLIPLRDLLRGELQERGLLELAEEDFRMACNSHTNGDRSRSEPAAWTRLSGRRDLTPQELAVLKELLHWRDRTAERLDRPPFKVVSEEKLIEIARAQPSSADELGAGYLGERQRREWGAQVLEAVNRGRNSPPIRRQRPKTPGAAYLKRLESLKEWRKKAASAMDVESDVVLPRGLLLELAEGGAESVDTVMGSSPWRLRRFGQQIAAAMQTAPSD